MTRHSKNSTANAVYTYHEKHKDSSTGGYGTTQMRLSKDAIKEFDCCNLTLQPCRDPVITKDGYLFDKQAILGEKFYTRNFGKSFSFAENVIEWFSKILFSRSDSVSAKRTILIETLVANGKTSKGVFSICLDIEYLIKDSTNLSYTNSLTREESQLSPRF
jgi:hypothetical protein